jgi:hypothetical protein
VIETLLWALLILAFVALVVMQVRSIRAAWQMGGSSARGVIALRVALTIAMVALLVFVVYTQVAR